ncbi:MAG: ABC-F family ATP-binding cassette domain-containing protein [Deltaproteobacteria bacterium]|nr:ABC-F family ATP-binding cassette domain-containing protein [Deltaproteobacteria bacterium]
MISLRNLGKSFGDRVLFEGVSMHLLRGNRYGLVGANGSGKTTLLQVLAGDLPASDGQVSIPTEARVGVLRQDRFLDGEVRVVDVAMRGDARTYALLREREALDGGAPVDPSRAAELEHQLAALDGYTLEARAGAVLVGLGIPTKEHRQPLKTLSGGFQLRVLLAQVLVGGPDALLLDEPTNHLDILSIRWLEKFLAAYRGCAVVISHDQRFLDHLATHVLDVDYGTVTAYTGNYSAFVAQKAQARLQKEQEKARAEARIADGRAFIERFGAKATKARQAQSRLKQIEKIEVLEVASSSRRAPSLRFIPERPSGREVLTLDGVHRAFGDKTVLRDVTFSLRRGEKVAVLGANGLGKSTLLKVALGRLAPDAGKASWGYETRVGYFAQDHRELLNEPGLTPLKYLWDARPAASQTEVRSLLGHALFSSDEVHKPVERLSGGEAARLVFARIMAERPNVLLLDEPTNHLDLESIQALTEALRRYEGTVLFVSHDRWFVAALATRVLEVTADGVRDFPGSFEDYLERAGDDHLDAEVVSLRAKAAQKAQATAEPPRTETWREEKRRKNRLKDLPRRRDQTLAAIEAAEARKREIDALWGDPEFYARTPRDAQDALTREEASLKASLDELLARWEALEAELAPPD